LGKKNPDRTFSTKGSIVFDEQFVNSFGDKSRHFPALQPRHSEVIKAILWWSLRCPKVPIRLAKKDISEAFKWLWLLCESAGLFATDLPDADVETSLVAIYLVMTFGCTGAPGEFMVFAWLLKLLHSSFKPENPTWNDSTPFHSFFFMDDQLLVEPDIGQRPEMSKALAEALIKVPRRYGEWGMGNGYGESATIPSASLWHYPLPS
jgi:hypothetical protein